MNKNKNRNSQQRSRYNHSDSDQRAKNQAQYSRYLALGKDALAQGDKIEAERNFQYAEHYVRMLEKFPARNNNPAESVSNEEVLQTIDETFPISVQEDIEENTEKQVVGKSEPKKTPSKKRARSKPVQQGQSMSSPVNDLDLSSSKEKTPATLKKRNRQKTAPPISETEA